MLGTHLHKSTFNKLGERRPQFQDIASNSSHSKRRQLSYGGRILVYVSQEGRILGSSIHNGLLLLITGTTNPQYKTVLVKLSGVFDNKISEFIAVLLLKRMKSSECQLLGAKKKGSHSPGGFVSSYY